MSWFPQTLLAIIAACAAWIAFQQMAIARQKLNHDLFDRRFAVYIAMRDYMAAVLNRDEDMRQKAFVYHNAIAPAPFLFNEEIAVYLREVQRHGIAVVTFSEAIASATDERRQEYLSTINEHRQWLGQQIDYEKFTSIFKSSLDLSRLSPFSIKETLPHVDFDKIKSGVTAIIKGKQHGKKLG